MEIVSIEKKTFEEMVAQTDAFVEKVAALQLKGDAKRLKSCNRAFFKKFLTA